MSLFRPITSYFRTHKKLVTAAVPNAGEAGVAYMLSEPVDPRKRPRVSRKRPSIQEWVSSKKIKTEPQVQYQKKMVTYTKQMLAREKYYNSKKYKRRVKKNWKSLQKQIMATHPAKHATRDIEQSAKHQTIYTFSPTQGISQGNGNTQRDGDSIHLEALKLKGFYVTNATSGAYQMRMLIGYSGEEYDVATDFGNGLSSGQIFLPDTTTTWSINGIVNPKAFTLLYDQTVDVNSQLASTQDINNIAVTVPLKTKFDYQSTGSAYGKLRNLYVVIICAVAGGTTGTTDVGQVIMSSDLIFKNT